MKKLTLAQIGLLLLFFFLPFERLPSLEMGGYTIKISQMMILFTLTAFMFYLGYQKDFKFDKNPLALPLLLFLAATLISVINSNALFRSLIVFILLLFVLAAFFLTANLIRNEKYLKMIMTALFVVTFLVCVFGIYQYIGDQIGLAQTLTGLREAYTKKVLGFPRIQATALEPLLLADFLIIPASLFFALFFSDQIKTRWVNIMIFAVILLTVFVLTAARSGYLGVGVALFIIIIFRFKSFFSYKKFFTWLLMLILAGTAVYILLDGSRELFFSHAQKPMEGGKEASSEERKETLRKAYQGFQEHPVFGIGLGTFGPFYANYPSQMPQQGWQTVNNQFVEILAETGIVGFVAFILFLIIIFFRSAKIYFKAKNPYLAAVLLGSTAALAGILAQYYFFSTIYLIHFWVLIGLIAAVQNIILKTIKKEI